MSDDKVQACPFCGVEAIATNEIFGSVIHCDHLNTCPLEGHGKLASAVKEWNTRAQPSDGALTPEPFFYALCGPDGKPHYQECCVSGKAHHLEPDADGVTVIPVYRHAPVLTNEGAEPVVLTNAQRRAAEAKEQQAFNDWAWNKEGAAIGRMEGQVAASEAWHARSKLAPAPTCTCPSGDGSLRWPCPVHPPEVKAVLPERKKPDEDGFDADHYAYGWNACLDRVKELNS